MLLLTRKSQNFIRMLQNVTFSEKRLLRKFANDENEETTAILKVNVEAEHIVYVI